MKLHIRRNQAAKKGMLGGHKGMRFSLSCRVEISPEEQELIEKYQVHDHPLVWWEDEDEPPLRVRNLINGHNATVENVATLLRNEDIIKDACKDFKNLLTVMATFGGEEVIEI